MKFRVYYSESNFTEERIFPSEIAPIDESTQYSNSKGRRNA